MHFHEVFLGSQHEIWSKQHNGKVSGADLAFVKDWLGHANIQNTTIYARLTTATLDSTARKVFASHRGV